MPSFSNIILGDNDPVVTPNQDPTPLDNDPSTTPLDDPNVEPSNNDPSVQDPASDPAADVPIMIGDTELVDGTELETADGVLTFREGQLFDKDGKVFKDAKSIRDYLSQFNESDGTPEFNLAAVQGLFGIDVTDENGNPVEFADDETGRTAYVNKVIELKQKEASDIALNTFFANNPLIKQFTDFVTAGGDYRNFGQIPDRTGIEFDPANANQHKAIIRAAWNEFGKRGSVESYIKYLEDSGGLADAAKEDLKAIQDKDKAYMQDMQARAEQARREEAESINNYWKAINDKISSGVISGYKIPESVTREVNGQKIALSRRDFFDYISKQDPKTHQTQYQTDLENMSDSDAMDRELLDAWMHFTGGTYKDIINLAVKDEEVKRLKLQSKAAKTPGTVKLNKPNSKVSPKDIILQ